MLKSILFSFIGWVLGAFLFKLFEFFYNKKEREMKTKDVRLKNIKHESGEDITQIFSGFYEIAEPAVYWLRKNYHPNAHIVIEWNQAYVLEEKMRKPYLDGLS